MFDSNRGNGQSISQHFIDTKFPKCPMCGTDEPYWTHKFKIYMMGNRIMFLCEKCGAILSATVADITISEGKDSFAIARLCNKAIGKNNNIIYIKVENIGTVQSNKDYQGKEMPIEELQALGESSGLTWSGLTWSDLT